MKAKDKDPSGLLDNLVIASPCSIPWEAMSGDDRKRLCNGCSRTVHNISDMTKNEAENFLQENGTSHCMIFYRRFDGTILTDDCPVGLRKIRNACRFAFRVAASILAMLVSLPGALAQSSKSGDAKEKQPPIRMNRFGMIVGPDWKEPTPPPGFRYEGNPAGGGMILRPISPKDPPVTATPVANPIPVYPGQTVLLPPPNSTGKPDPCLTPPLVVRHKKDPKTAISKHTPTLKDQVDPQEHRLLDTKAHDYFEKARAAQNIGRKDLAEYYYEHALESFDNQKSGDQRFRNEIVRALQVVKN